MNKLNFIREIDTKDLVEKCRNKKMKPIEILDYLDKYDNMDSCYIYENLPDDLQKEVDKLIIERLIKNGQRLKELREEMSKLDISIKHLKNEMLNYDDLNADYFKISDVHSSLTLSRVKLCDEMCKLKTYSKFGPYIFEKGEVWFDDNIQEIETALFRLNKRFERLKLLEETSKNDEDSITIEEIIRNRMIVENLNTQLSEIDKEYKKLRETSEVNQFQYELLDRQTELYKLVNDIENSTPKLKHDRCEMITHELESVKNRLRKMKNHYPWSEFNPLNSVELDEINKLNQEIDSLQQQIEKISLASQQSC
jgi:hypothetical protein